MRQDSGPVSNSSRVSVSRSTVHHHQSKIAPASCRFGIQRHLDNVSAIILLINNQLNLSKHSSPNRVSSSHGTLAKCLSTLLAVIRAKDIRDRHFGQFVQPKVSCCLRRQVLGSLQSKSELHASSSLQKIYHKSE